MAAGDLTTLASLEQFLSLASGNADEPLLSALITAASALAVTYCGQSFVSADFTETRNGVDNRAISLKNTPITAIASLTVNGNAIPASSGWGSSGYFFNDTTVMLRGYKFLRGGMGNVTIAYTAGYATIPADLAQAVNELVALRYKERKHFDERSEGVAQQTTAFFVGDLKPSTKTVLDRYRRIVPGWP